MQLSGNWSVCGCEKEERLPGAATIAPKCPVPEWNRWMDQASTLAGAHSRRRSANAFLAVISERKAASAAPIAALSQTVRATGRAVFASMHNASNARAVNFTERR